MMLRWVWSGLLCIAGSVRAVEVLDVSPEHPTSRDEIAMTAHIEDVHRLHGVRTYRYGTSIKVFVDMSDVVAPNQPPPLAETRTFGIGRFPPGDYQLDVYVNAENLRIHSQQLGVAAVRGIPTTSSNVLVALAALLGGWGLRAARSRMASSQHESRRQRG